MEKLTDSNKFKEITRAISYHIKKDNNFYLMGINWAQIIRHHPEYFKKYLSLNKNFFFYTDLFYRVLKFSFLILKQLIKSIGVFENYTKDVQYNKNIDFLIISHFINKNHVSLKDDFYFGEIINNLTKENYKVNLFLNNHTKSSAKFIEKGFFDFKSTRFVSKSSLKFRDEFIIVMNGIKILFNLWLKPKTNNKLIDRVRLILGVEAISPASFNAERLALQLEYLVQKIKPKAIVFTFEGHSWERLVIKKVKALKVNILCIGYVHTIAFPNQHSSLINYQNEYMPDYILVSGNETKKVFEKNIINSIPIKVLGSQKKINVVKKLETKNKITILILPEGFFSETDLLTRLGLDLAKKHPIVDIRVRLHPNMLEYKKKYIKLIQKHKLNNVKISEFELRDDISWSTHALYRGSTSIIEAVLSDVIPIYCGLKNELTIDPLFCKTDSDHQIFTVEDIILMLDNWKKMSPEDKVNYKRSYVEFCTGLYGPLNINILKDLIRINK